MAEVVGAEAAFDFGAGQGVFPGGLEAFYRLFFVVDDRAGFFVRLPPGFQLGLEAFMDGHVAAGHAAFIC